MDSKRSTAQDNFMKSPLKDYSAYPGGSVNKSYAIAKLTRRNDPETSRLAANRVFPHLSNIQERVLVFVKNCTAGCTDLDISNYFEEPGSTYRTRRAELVAMGRIKDSGRTIKQAGSRRTVWEYVE